MQDEEKSKYILKYGSLGLLALGARGWRMYKSENQKQSESNSATNEE